MEIKTQYDLAKISMMIGTLARGQTWEGHTYTKGGDNTDISEVQCAFLEGDNRIFIAGNKNEHTQIQKALNSCGISNISNLIDTARRAHKLFTLPDEKRHELGIKHFYSAQDILAYNLVHTANSSFNTAPLTEDSEKKIKNIIEIGDNAQNPAEISSKDIWLYKKLSGKNISKKISKPSGTLRIVKTPSNIREQTVNIIENKEDSHAELALLKFFTQGFTEGLFNQSAIYLGGRKIACANCRVWIENYRKILASGFSLHTPEDTRPETQSNPGTCPSAFTPPLSVTSNLRIDTTSDLFATLSPKLFSGDVISTVTW
ncbi:hypothetical protein AAIM60_22695 [Pseudomonas lijiangensis]|uniref:hypothetical protein n=1 Tax=Pseudomonas lijiangensis TaxID=2995658 RepID=UPI0031B9AEB8